MTKVSPTPRAYCAEVEQSIAVFVEAIREQWPDVDIDVAYEQLCCLGGMTTSPVLDAKARKAIMAELINGCRPSKLNRLIVLHAKHTLRRIARHRARVNRHHSRVEKTKEKIETRRRGIPPTRPDRHRASKE